MKLNINSDAVVKYTNTLEKMHRSALPVAVRETLNNAAFDVKTRTMPEKSSQEFKNRQKNFFKANSKVEKASGFNMQTMKSTIGFTDLNDKNNHAIKDLEQQEYGGTIKKKSFIANNLARAGGSQMGLIRSNARLSKINKIIKAKNSPGKNKREQFVIAASIAGKGGFVLTENVLFRIDTAPSSNMKTKKTNFKSTPVYSFKKGRTVRVKPTHFMHEASVSSANKMEGFYIAQAEKQINKLR